MKVEQKSYAQIILLNPNDFIFSSLYGEYEMMCPFMCFPGIVAGNIRASLKRAEDMVLNKDVIFILEPYWNLLDTHEQKAILDHELGHIASGHLKVIEEKIRRAGSNNIENEVNEADEKQADAYSADMNGHKAMHGALLKALEVMVQGYKKKGYRISVDDIIKKDSILRNRLKVLKEEDRS